MPNLPEDHLGYISRAPLLTPLEEIELGRRIKQRNDLISQQANRSLTPRELRICKRGEKAKERMVTANLRLVAHVARKYQTVPKSMSYGDIIQEGAIGLMRAADKFDPERGYKFSTYAYWWIRQGITRAISQQDRIIKLPCNAEDIMHKMRKHARSHLGAHGHYPTLEESAVHINTPKEQLELLLKMSTSVTSLNFRSHDTDNEIIDLIYDETADTPMSAADRSESIGQLRQAVGGLSEDERTIIQSYYGLNGKPSVTLGEIANHRSVSREAIRQRVMRINNKLRYRLA